jgi:homoserine kinase
MKEEIAETLKNALELINTELETNGHPDNIDLEYMGQQIDDMITELDFIDEFEKFDE